MSGTVGRYSTQTCSGVVPTPVFRHTASAARCISQAKRLPQRKPRSHATIVPPHPLLIECKWRCMVSNRHQNQPITSNVLKTLNVINDSTKYVVTLAAGGVLIWYHDIYVSWCLLGSVVAVFVCKALKKAINSQRPALARKQDPGMPSSHASSLAYLAVYLAVAWKPDQPALANSGLVLAAVLIPLRVILGYHSILQVIVGAGLGGASASVWNAIGQQVVLPTLESDLHSRQLLAAATVAALMCYMVAAFRSK